jgi:uncharacterized repeat protein (TIGR01451 family)
VVNVELTATSPLTNTATVSGEPTDPNTENNSATEETTVLSPSPSADLSVTKGDSPDPVTAGEDLTYTIVVTNNGPSAAQTASLTDALPLETTFVSLAQSGTGGWSCTTPTVDTNGLVSCTKATVAANESTTFTVVVHVIPSTRDGAIITNTAAVVSPTDTTPTNNTATATTTVTVNAGPPADDPDLSVVMSDSPDPVTAGGVITYTITVDNAGPADAADVVLDDPTPAFTTFVSLASAEGWTCSTPPVRGTGVVSCSTASLPDGANVAFTLVVRVNPGTPAGVILNTATVSYTTSDPNPANNVATATTTVARVPLPGGIRP